jgi:alkaline phosphatase D
MDSTRRHILDLSRRGLLRGATAAAALAALQPAIAQRVWAQPVFARYPFSLGVASGDPLPDGVVIWTRLAPDPLAGGGMPRMAVEVGWEVAEDPAFARIVQRGTALARPELGHAVHVEVGGLAPGRPYHYRFRAGAEVSPIGRTRTAPAPDAAPARLRFVNAGCQHYEHGHFTAWRHIAAEPELDFVFHYGDYIYEYRARGNQPGTWPAVRQHQGEEIHTLDDYRNRYALYRLDADLAAAHAAHPFLVSFDDHEVDNNWAAGISEEDGSARFPVLVPPEIFALRKQIAFQVWYEMMPLRRSALPRGPSILAHRRLRYGRLADIHVLDTRSHRSDQPCGDGVAVPCPEVNRPDSTMLGAEQEAWLLRNLEDRHATWQVLAQQVMIMERDLGDDLRGRVISMDKWDAMPAARQRLLDGVRARNAGNLVVLTGDLHNAWAGEVRANGGEGPALMTEFCATSISSNGDGTEALPATPTVLRRNPHLTFFNNRRGYCLHEAGPERMEVTFRAVDYVSRPGAPLVDKGRFVVEAGRAALARA